MCYNKDVFKKYYVPEPEQTAQLLQHLKKSKDLLLQIKEQPCFDLMFTKGECGSIDAMIKKTTERIEVVQQWEKAFS